MSHLCEISLIDGSFIYMKLPLPPWFLEPICTSIPFPKIIKGKLGCRFMVVRLPAFNSLHPIIFFLFSIFTF